MLAGTERGLQKVMDSFNATAAKYGKKINIKQTEVMKVSKMTGGKVNIKINGNKIEQVQSFKYLGSTMTEDDRCETEMKVRIVLAKEVINKRKKLLTERFKMDFKSKLVKALVWIILLYGCEI